MFFNISNHPSSNWDEKQKNYGEKLGFGEIKDIKFPNVSPETKDLTPLVLEVLNQLPKNGEIKDDWDNRLGVHWAMVMGEISLCYHLTNELLKSGYRVVVATTERVTTEKNGVKSSTFNFVAFREIQNELFPKLNTWNL